MKIGVILFPGLNCELEALRALKRAGMSPQIIRWNDQSVDYSSFDGFLIPGGFSYEDRGRAGVVASKDPLITKVKAEAKKGKPVIGICNGAQIVIETKMIPGLDSSHIEMSIATNKRIDKDGKILGRGFYNDWINMKHNVEKRRSAFNNFDSNHIMRVPVAHQEGRYTTLDKGLIETLKKNNQILFQYCDDEGKIVPEYPVNPNGAVENIAGICNPEGNVLSLMPHPERTLNGQAIFDSMAEYIEKKFTLVKPSDLIESRPTEVELDIQTHEKPEIEIFVDLIIKDTEERTIEKTIHLMGYNEIKLKKQLYYGIKPDGSIEDYEKLVVDLLKTGQLINFNKEQALIKIREKYYTYTHEAGLSETDAPKLDNDNENVVNYLTSEEDNYTGKSYMQTLKMHFNIEGIKDIYWGKKWILNASKEKADEIVRTMIFHNPHAMNIYAL